MSLFNKFKDVSIKAGNAIAREYSKQQQKAVELKEEAERQAVAEESRRQKIASGKIEPISVSMRLKTGEKAYLELTARRLASVESVIEETIGKSKKKHVIRRAVVGGVLTGGIGAIVGGATAGSRHTSTTTQRTVSSTELVDSGKLVLTNERFVFIGNNNVISLPYDEVIVANFNGNQVSIKYSGMLNDEHYDVFGLAANDAQLYYNAITQNKIGS